MPNLFAALAKGEAIDTAEAGRDRRTSELFASYLQPLEISSVYITPIVMAGRLMGMMSIEDPQRGDRAAGLATFCDALSILLALRFTAAAAPTAWRAAGDGRRPPPRPLRRPRTRRHPPRRRTASPSARPGSNAPCWPTTRRWTA